MQQNAKFKNEFNTWYATLKKLWVWETVRHKIDNKCVKKATQGTSFIYYINSDNMTVDLPPVWIRCSFSYELIPNISLFSNIILGWTIRYCQYSKTFDLQKWHTSVVQHNTRVFLSYLYAIIPTCLLSKISVSSLSPPSSTVWLA